MKNKSLLSTLLALGVLAGLTACETGHKHAHESQEQLMSQAKVSKEQAQQTALAKVPNGTIKDAELEKEKGKLQWSFDVATPDSKDITEVNVDAITGEVISAAKESPEDQAKEAAEDARKEKKEKADKD